VHVLRFNVVLGVPVLGNRAASEALLTCRMRSAEMGEVRDKIH